MCNHHSSDVDRRIFLKSGLFAGAASGLLGAVAASPATAQESAGAAVDEATTTKIIESWPETAQKSAKQTIEKYGQPQEATPTRLIWFNNGPWKRTIINKEEIDHDFPMPHKDVMEQFINYQVPPDTFDDLAHYDGSVIAERTKGELSARCDKEEANFLALNLANDVAQGTKSVEEARQFYVETIQAFMNGEKPPYTQGFQFEVSQEDQGDPDKALIEKKS